MLLGRRKNNILDELDEISYGLKSGKETRKKYRELKRCGFRADEFKEYAPLVIGSYFWRCLTHDTEGMISLVSCNAYHKSNNIILNYIRCGKNINILKIRVENVDILEYIEDKENHYGVYCTADVFTDIAETMPNGSIEKRTVHKVVVAKFIRKKGKDLSVDKDAMINKCPACGEKSSVDKFGRCKHCKEEVSFGKYCWLLDATY